MKAHRRFLQSDPPELDDFYRYGSGAGVSAYKVYRTGVQITVRTRQHQVSEHDADSQDIDALTLRRWKHGTPGA